MSDAAKTAGLTLEGLGITADSLEAIPPQYLWRFRPRGQFQRRARKSQNFSFLNTASGSVWMISITRRHLPLT